MTNERDKRMARAEAMRKDREKAEKRQRNLITVAIVAVVVILVGMLAWAYQGAKPDLETKVVTPQGVGSDYGIVYDAKAAGVTQPAKDPVRIDLYEDFQCPACQQFEQSTGSFMEGLVKSRKATLVYHPWSFLDSKASLNEYSHRSTNVALLLLEKGGVAKYVEFHDYLYQHQPEEGTAGPEDKELIAAAKSIGVTISAKDVKNRKFFPWIDKAKAAGAKRGVTGTPTIFVAGKQLSTNSQAAILQAIDAAQKK